MDKLKMHSRDNVKENIAQIAALFPNAVTETIKDGKVVQSIDFDILKQELSEVVVEGPSERYQFTWPDKRKSILLANTPIAKTLRPDREESVDFDTTGNLYIEGDNLDALKILQETYLGAVKMIYIDPPYNTGNDFIYDDDFAQNPEDYKNISGQIDDKGGRLVANLESNGRFHTDWLNMMYPRLKLARNLLSEEGVILVSISDKELSNSILLMNEIFGENNQVCIFTWKSRAKPTNAGNARFRPQKTGEYIIVYGRKPVDNLFFNVLSSKSRAYPHEDAEGKYRTTTILTSNRGSFRRETMRFQAGGFQPDEDYRWKAGQDVINDLFDRNRIFLNDDGIPLEKKYEQEEDEPLYSNSRYELVWVNFSQRSK